VHQSPANTPTSIHADRAASSLSIDWADGHASVYEAESLRRMCPCAFCRGEAGRPGWLDTNPTLTPTQKQLTGARLVGAYALALTWADGHDSGFYTFESLRDQCPCPACAANRGGRS
jgi:DUF971 family protein